MDEQVKQSVEYLMREHWPNLLGSNISTLACAAYLAACAAVDAKCPSGLDRLPLKERVAILIEAIDNA